jgi:hypothetical protein
MAIVRSVTQQRRMKTDLEVILWVIVNCRWLRVIVPVTVAARSTAWTVFARSDASRSRLPNGLMHELSSLARTLWSRVRIPLRAWMFSVYMCLFCVCVVVCLGRGLATSWSLAQESYQLWIDQETEKRPGPTRAVEPLKKSDCKKRR